MSAVINHFILILSFLLDLVSDIQSCFYYAINAELILTNSFTGDCVDSICVQLLNQVIPYVNGALYSILAMPSIREEAIAMVGDIYIYIYEN